MSDTIESLKARVAELEKALEVSHQTLHDTHVNIAEHDEELAGDFEVEGLLEFHPHPLLVEKSKVGVVSSLPG